MIKCLIHSLGGGGARGAAEETSAGNGFVKGHMHVYIYITKTKNNIYNICLYFACMEQLSMFTI